jgi:hypothetical protein
VTKNIVRDISAGPGLDASQLRKQGAQVQRDVAA